MDERGKRGLLPNNVDNSTFRLSHTKKKGFDLSFMWALRSEDQKRKNKPLSPVAASLSLGRFVETEAASCNIVLLRITNLQSYILTFGATHTFVQAGWVIDDDL